MDGGERRRQEKARRSEKEEERRKNHVSIVGLLTMQVKEIKSDTPNSNEKDRFTHNGF